MCGTSKLSGAGLPDQHIVGGSDSVPGRTTVKLLSKTRVTAFFVNLASLIYKGHRALSHNEWRYLSYYQRPVRNIIENIRIFELVISYAERNNIPVLLKGLK